MDTIVQLTNYVSKGFNILDGSFLGKPLFKLTYRKDNKIEWNGTDKLYPDQIAANTSTNYYSSRQTLLLENEADYDRTYSASIDAEYSGAVYSASMNSSFMYHGNLFQSAASTYGLDFYVQSLLEFKRLQGLVTDDLDPDFINALKGLPRTIDTDTNRKKYVDIFDGYGTHYLDGGSVGGTIIMETEIRDSLFKSTSATEVKAAVNAGYQGVVNSGKISASAAYSASDFLKEHRNEISVSLSVMGGLYAPDGSISDWQKSIYGSPIILLGVPSQTRTISSRLLCISNLVTIAGVDDPEKVKANIYTMIGEYVAAPSDRDGLIGSLRSIDLNTVINAENSAGFVLATIDAPKNGNRGWIKGFDDNAMDPKTLRVCSSQHWYTGSDIWVPSASFLMPAVGGWTYKTTAQSTSGEPNMTASFIGFGNRPEPALGEWREIAIGDNTHPATNRADSDGFVVAWIAANNNGERGFVQGFSDGICHAGASVHSYSGSDHRVPYNSFTMPAQKGSQYSVTCTKTWGQPVAAAFFVPITQIDAVFKGYEELDPDHEYTATTDGFLFAYLDAKVDGNRGQVAITCYPDSRDPGALCTTAGTSVHAYGSGDSHISINSTMIPVPKGYRFKSSKIDTSGRPELKLWWMGLAMPGNGSMTAVAVQ